MRTTKQAARRARIEETAYSVLKEAGYKSTSLLAVAQRASASNETLYKWYGNKQGLFRELVEANAREARLLLEDSLHRSGDPLGTLAALGPILLALVTGEKAVILNRAAASDVSDTGTLGQAIAQFGRETIAPLVCDLLTAARREGVIACNDPAEATEIYFGLLIGDLQIRRVIGVLDELSAKAIDRRAQRAFELFLALHAPSHNDEGDSQ
ncbi:TetR/AcrR family transcriptional regulator [Mesorhizobium tianshanense]|uniref:TetR family transcriptional regulator n=1 Tax=Mesorhizobium tianshanense TaxID=39844 RepID=A0A562NBK6_9HYPH|nr:TetR/AcrR family transcriptional regulator [Mesorhizobium tianshanense]TWI29483.1 TetR family transcriptional regulator [Mesorhizobium tianshanense]